jgi:TatD DNase family protein
VEMLPAFLRLGAYLSVSGAFFRPGREHKLAPFRLVPADRLLVETDAPDMIGPASCVEFDMTPDAEGRARNHPGNLRRVYEHAARLRNQPLEEFARGIEANFQRLFGPI